MPVVAHVVTQPDDAPATLPEAVLDTVPARQAQLTAASPVQGVALSLPADDGSDDDALPPIIITFHMDAPDLRGDVAEAADLAFVTSGLPGVQAFSAALNGTIRYVGGAFSLLSYPVPTPGEDRYIDDETTPQRGRLMREFADYRNRLPD